MGFFSDISRLLKVSTKPDRKEIMLIIRVTILGMGLLGLLGFILKIIGNEIFYAKPEPTSSTPSGAAILILFQLFSFLAPLLH